MTEQARLALTDRAALHLEAVRDATVHAPKEPPRTLLWPASLRVRIPVLVLSILLGGGWLGGSIAIYISVIHVHPTLAAALGLTQSAPLVFAARWPLVAWRIMAIGFLGGVLATIHKDEFWPWPVPSPFHLKAGLRTGGTTN